MKGKKPTDEKLADSFKPQRNLLTMKNSSGVVGALLWLLYISQVHDTDKLFQISSSLIHSGSFNRQNV